MPEAKAQTQQAAPDEIAEAAGLSDEAKSKLRAEITASGFMRELVGAGLLSDAVKYLAQGLGPKRAVLWALACVKALRVKIPESEAALAAFEAWAAEPSDANRRNAAEALKDANADSAPEKCVGQAIFFSGGSIAPPEVNAVPPPPHVAEKLAAAAIILAVVSEMPEKAVERYQKCIELALKG